MKKYEFTGETKQITIEGEVITLHQIKAIRDFSTLFDNVKVGDLGGWIEKEENLSHDGEAWVTEHGEVCQNAKVCNNGMVHGHAFGNVVICENGIIGCMQRVGGHKKTSDLVIRKSYNPIWKDGELVSF